MLFSKERIVFFYQPVQNDLITYENIQKIGIDQANDSTTVVYKIIHFFRKYYEFIGNTYR